jgi:hypothetical protein
MEGTLAELLGHGAVDRLLILHCDDLGVSAEANRAIHAALTRGLATGASLMVPCPAAREGAALCRGLPLGVHLTLTSEYATHRWCGLTEGASLHDDDGLLPRTAQAALDRLSPTDAREECRAQIIQALDWGCDVTHLDAHMDVMLSRSDLLEVYLDLAEEFRLPVRMQPAAMAAAQGFRARERAEARGLLFPDHMLYPWPRPSGEVLREEAAALAPGVTEMFFHPVEDGPVQRARDPRFAALRAADARDLLDPALAALLDAQGIIRTGYRALRDLQRA